MSVGEPGAVGRIPGFLAHRLPVVGRCLALADTENGAPAVAWADIPLRIGRDGRRLEKFQGLS